MSDSTDATAPRSGFYCPVCATPVERLWVWRAPSGDRIRVFCRDCAVRPDYRGLREEERLLYAEDDFNRLAGQRLLRAIFDKEHSVA